MNNLRDNGNFFKNPIGVIGIFLVLVEAIASFVIVQSTLTDKQNTILVWFIVLFPCLVLVAFYLLVTKHHEKLYSPSDYRDEQNFMKSFNSVTRKDEIKKATYNEMSVEQEVEETDKVRLMKEALVNVMELQKKIVPAMESSTLTEDEKDEYVSYFEDYLSEMENDEIELKVSISPMYKSNKLVEELEKEGYNASIYYAPFSTRKLVSNSEHKAIWLGSEVPVDMAIKVIRLSKMFYPHLKYIQLSDGTQDEPEYVLYQIYIGGSTNTAKENKLIPLEIEDFERMYEFEEKKHLHDYVRSFESKEAK